MIKTHLALATGVRLQTEGSLLRVVGKRRHVVSAMANTNQASALQSLTGQGATRPQLYEHASGSRDRLQLEAFLLELERCGLVEQTLWSGRLPLASCMAISDYYRPQSIADRMPRFVVSRFAYCHQVEGRMVLESPRSPARVTFHDWRPLAVLATLTRGAAEAAIPEVSEELKGALIRFLAVAGMLVPLDEMGDSEESKHECLRQWEFHDLLFHARSRAGRHDHPVGGTRRFRGKIRPQSPFKPTSGKPVVSLYKPDLDELKAHDVPFTQVLEARRSRRADRDEPLTATQLGEFLFRSARVQRFDERSSGTWHVYPSGGALNELEVYVLAHHCDGLQPGLYRYDSRGHQLERWEAREEDCSALLEQARASHGGETTPAVLLLITARFQRVSWKYSSMAYALILKNLGGLFQTLYLVGAAMDLAPCAIGCGNADLFARATGLEYEVEGTVGEFVLR